MDGDQEPASAGFADEDQLVIDSVIDLVQVAVADDSDAVLELVVQVVTDRLCQGFSVGVAGHAARSQSRTNRAVCRRACHQRTASGSSPNSRNPKVRMHRLTTAQHSMANRSIRTGHTPARRL